MTDHRVTSSGVHVFDLRDESHGLSRGEWSPYARRKPEDMRGVVLHAWGVRGVGTTTTDRRRHGEPLALARRALRVPYAASCGVTAHGGEPVVGLAHPLDRYTFASDAGNAGYAAIGVMGLFAFDRESHVPARHTEVTAALRAAVEAALLEAVAALREFTRRDGPWHLLTHRQCANGPRDHFACPGEAVVEVALQSAAVASGALVPDPDLVLDAKHGKPWPGAWRRHLQRRPAGEVDDLVHPLHEQLEV